MNKPTRQPYCDEALKGEMMEENKHTTIQDEREAEKESVLERLKPEINQFLYPLLPPETTLSEMENLAIKLHDEIRDKWEQARGKE